MGGRRHAAGCRDGAEHLPPSPLSPPTPVAPVPSIPSVPSLASLDEAVLLTTASGTVAPG